MGLEGLVNGLREVVDTEWGFKKIGKKINKIDYSLADLQEFINDGLEKYTLSKYGTSSMIGFYLTRAAQKLVENVLK